MAMLNIPSTCSDPQYRYKMPRLVTKIEGRGKGIKTCIVNMGDVARALLRPPQYTTKWFGNELGAQSTYTNKEGEGERSIVNGAHDTAVLQTLLDKFIDKYVCCENCGLPEVDLAIKKGTVVGKCKACGWAGGLDNGHKLAAFIKRNPPDEGGLGIVAQGLETGRGGKLSKEERRRAKLRKAREEEEMQDSDGDEQDRGQSNDETERVKKKHGKEDTKVKKSTKETNTMKLQALGVDHNEDGDEDGAEVKQGKTEKRKNNKNNDKPETNEKNEKRKAKEHKEHKNKKMQDSDEDRGAFARQRHNGNLPYDNEQTKTVISILSSFVASNGGKLTAADFFEEVRMQQLAKLFDHKVRLYIVLEALFGSSMDTKGISQQSKVIATVISSANMSTADVLWAFDAYLKVNPCVGKAYAMLVKCIYDEDWAQEEQLLAYYNEDWGEGEPGFDEAKVAVGPFLKWLETAESEDDDEDDDKSEDDNEKDDDD